MKKLISAMLAAAAIVSLAACAANKPVPEPDEPSRSSPSYPVPAEEPIEDEPAMPTAAAETTAETYFDETLPVADETEERSLRRGLADGLRRRAGAFLPAAAREPGLPDAGAVVRLFPAPQDLSRHAGLRREL